MDNQETQIHKIVAGMFGIASGSDLLAAFNSFLEGDGNDIQAFALALDDFLPDATNEERTDAFLNNFGFGVPADDADPADPAVLAQAYITERLDADVAPGQIVLNIVNFLSSDTLATDFPDFVPFANLLANRATLADIYSDELPSGTFEELAEPLNVPDIPTDSVLTEAEGKALLIAGGISLPVDFTFTAASDTAVEGSALIYTVTANQPVSEDTDVVFTVVPDDSDAADQGTSSTNLNDFTSGSFNPVTVTILAGQTTATFGVEGANDGITELPESFSVEATIGDTTLTVDSTLVDSDVQTFSLTIGEDNLQGTSGDDVFNAFIIEQSGGGTDETLENIDVITDETSTDSDILNATLDGGSPEPKVSGVEIINVRDVGGSTLGMANVSGVNEIWNRDSNNVSLDFNDIGSTDILLGVRDTVSDTDFEFADDVLAGSSDEVKISLYNAGTDTNDADIDVTDANLGGNQVESVMLTVMGENFADIQGVGNVVESLTIAGTGEVELDVDATALTTLDATGMTQAGLDIDISAASSTELSAKTGVGDDRVLIDGGLLIAANDGIEIDLGDGSNTLALANITNDTTLGTLVFDEATIAGVNIVELTDAITLAANGTLELNGLGDNVTGVVFGGAVGLAGFDLTVSNAPETLDVTFESTLDDAAGGGSLNFDEAMTVVINSEDTVGATNAVGIDGTSGDLKDLTLNAEDDAAFGVTGDGTNGSITKLTVNDAADTPDSVINVSLTDTVDLATIMATGGDDTGIQIDASAADFGATVTIDIGAIGVDGDGNLTNGFAYEAVPSATSSVREIFKFTGDNIGNVIIDDDASNFAVDGASFEAGVGGTADRIDFSSFDGVDELDDLSITFDGTDTILTASDDQFDGTITVAGVDLSTDAFNFIF